MKPKVALVRGNSRHENVRRALELVADDINLVGKSQVLIKPNMVSTTNQLAATHREALQVVLEFLRERYSRRIIIGEGTGVPAMEGYRNFGYVELAVQYEAELADLSGREWQEVQVYDRNFEPMKLRLSRLAMDSDYRISLCPAKTHDEVILTLSLKNMVMGSLFYEIPKGMAGRLRNQMRQGYQYIPTFIKYSLPFQALKAMMVSKVSDNDREKMHQGYPAHHLNLALLARVCPPQLSVIDGFEGMEGDGPVAGTAVAFRMAVASQDFVAADSLTAYLMGFRPSEIGYLWYAAQMGLGIASLEEMEIVGDEPEECRRQFLPHPSYPKQQHWRSPRALKLLG